MGNEHGTGHHDHEDHPDYLAHHFETEQQQVDSLKMGMWLFLVTEILLFGGLFVAYSYFRTNHPEIFIYAHQFLDKKLGGINTVVLIFSSFTMAWAVRAAMLRQRKLLVGLLAITLLCGCGFLGIKAVEYNAKWKHGLLWGAHYAPAHEQESGEPGAASSGEDTTRSDEGSSDSLPVDTISGLDQTAQGLEIDLAGHAGDVAAEPAVDSAPVDAATPTDDPLGREPSTVKPAAQGPAGLARMPGQPLQVDSLSHEVEPYNVRVFFSVYFIMTGLHGIHVIAGMVVIMIMLLRARRGDFDGGNFIPVDMTGLYWHLVDLIWIFLFPLLYLIH